MSFRVPRELKSTYLSFVKSPSEIIKSTWPLAIFNFVLQSFSDCCDGSDEYQSKKQCINTCYEEGRTAREEAERLAEVHKQGNSIREQLVVKGKQLKEEKQVDLYLYCFIFLGAYVVCFLLLKLMQRHAWRKWSMKWFMKHDDFPMCSYRINN